MKWLKEKGHNIYRSQGKFNISQGNFREHLRSSPFFWCAPCCSSFQFFELSYYVSLRSWFRFVIFVTISGKKRCLVHLNLQWFVAMLICSSCDLPVSQGCPFFFGLSKVIFHMRVRQKRHSEHLNFSMQCFVKYCLSLCIFFCDFYGFLFIPFGICKLFFKTYWADVNKIQDNVVFGHSTGNRSCLQKQMLSYACPAIITFAVK